MEQWYEVKESGVVPCMVDPDELRKDYNWCVSHGYKGRLIFENYSRAMLCLYERRDYCRTN